MKQNFASALKAVLAHEGGFSDHPLDPGGMTNLGVTRRVWEEWRGRPVSVKEMASLTPELVAPMYKAKYWDKVRGDDLPAGIDYVVFDAAVNSGPGRAIKWLQGAVGAEPDGALGPKTLAAVRAQIPSVLAKAYGDRRLAFLHDLPTWDTFGRGWAKRVEEVARAAAITPIEVST